MTKGIIGFIGAGKMASALISCICKNKNNGIIASDKNEKNLSTLRAEYKIETTKNNTEVARKSNIIFICVKPQDINGILEEIKDEIKSQLIVSIAAGIKIKHIEGILGNKRIIRVMPNINCLVGEMAAGFSAGTHATKENVKAVSKILGSAGMAFLLEENLLDTVGAVSGSGPAFFAYFIKSFEEAGIRNGLSKETAFKLAAQTALGTGKLLIENNLKPEDLISMVASKKGITIEGLKVLNKHNAKNILIKSINAAVKRSKELGK